MPMFPRYAATSAFPEMVRFSSGIRSTAIAPPQFAAISIAAPSSVFCLPIPTGIPGSQHDAPLLSGLCPRYTCRAVGSENHVRWDFLPACGASLRQDFAYPDCFPELESILGVHAFAHLRDLSAFHSLQ